MAPFLDRALAPDARLDAARVHHVRYEPGRKLTVRYHVAIGGRQHVAIAVIAAAPYLARRAARPENVALARLVGDRSPARMPLRYEPELDALIQWYPLDLKLPALAEPTAQLIGELRAAGLLPSAGNGDPVTLAYRPGRRAVLRVGGRVLKLYGNDADFATATANLAAAGRMRGIRVAALEGHLPRRLITVQPWLSGSPAARSADIARDAGSLLRELHAAWGLAAADGAPAPGTGPPIVGPSRQLEVVATSARFVAAILPALAGRVQALLRELAGRTPSIDRLVLSHGDFSARQLIVTPDGPAVVDLDAIQFAPAALDPATFGAHLVFGGPDDLDLAIEALEQLSQGYGGRPAGLSWYLAACILRHARAPFRYFDEQWPERVETMVAAAESALEL